MKFSIVPLFIVAIFIFPILLTVRAHKRGLIDRKEALGVYSLLVALALWTGVAILMGAQGLHVSLMSRIPLLWQATVAVGIEMIAFALFPVVRRGLLGIAIGTPMRWLVLFQALRIAAIGSVIKALEGEISSAFPLWVGIPDLLFGVSALLLGWIMSRRTPSERSMIVWNVIGIAVILLPLFAMMPYWMNEPGFVFIFEFPMIMAPSIVVPMFISLNGLMAWSVWKNR
jgi:hypothetical protein